MMTLEQIEAMDDRELDAMVAEKVMGLAVLGEWDCYSLEGSTDVDADHSWVGSGYDSVRPVYKMADDVSHDEHDALVYGRPSWTIGVVPSYSTDPAADYTILEYARDNWGIDEQMAFVCAVAHIRQDRVNIDSVISYSVFAHEFYAMPGDYAKAALLVATGKDSE